MVELSQRLQTALGRHYAIEREIGSGGMATVFLATDLHHHRSVAVKVLRAEAAASIGADRFLREIGIIATLQHPHIMPLFDSGEADGFLYYVMPFVAGESLRERLVREPPLRMEEALQLAQDVAGALDYAHRHGVIHRDIKPENILLEEGHAILADFGVAREIDGASTIITGERVAIGTAAYMSPEVCSGGSRVDGRGDLYSLACVTYEMLTGRPPFSAPSTRALMARHVVDLAPSLTELRPEVPRAVARALGRALAKDPADRFPTLAAFQLALSTPSEDPDILTSVAVLPFANGSSDPTQEYLSIGLTDEISNALARLQNLRVASRTSTFALKGHSHDVRAIGERLNVQAVLEGSVSREGNRLRVTAQLVDTADGYQLWADRYEREIEDVFAIEEEIAQSIVRALRVISSDRERRGLGRAPTSSIKAYECYLRGRQYLYQTRKKSLQYARELFAKAIQLDPKYALAHAGLADAVSLLNVYFPSAVVDLAEADTASQRALELAPELPEAHTSRAFALWMLGKDQPSRDEFATALRLDPRQFDALYFQARSQFQHGEFEAAAQGFERAAEVREDHQARFFAAQSFAALGRMREATAAYRQALAVVQDHLALNPDDPRAATMCAVTHCRLGDLEAGLAWAERALKIDPEDPGVRYNVACLYAVEDRREDAIGALEAAVATGFGNVEWLERDPDLESIREDPRFGALMTRLRSGPA